MVDNGERGHAARGGKARGKEGISGTSGAKPVHGGSTRLPGVYAVRYLKVR